VFYVPSNYGLRGFFFRRLYFYTELRIYTLRYRFRGFVCVDRIQRPFSIEAINGYDIMERIGKVFRDGRDNMSDIKLFKIHNGVEELSDIKVSLEREFQTLIEQYMPTFFEMFENKLHYLTTYRLGGNA